MMNPAMSPAAGRRAEDERVTRSADLAACHHTTVTQEVATTTRSTPGTSSWIRSRPLLIAHRGHSIGAPEQTLAAYRRAIDLGADMIEADVQLTHDLVPVMLHDRMLDRTTNGRGPVDEIDMAALARLDAGSWFGAEYTTERVPRLADLLDLAGSVGLCLEAKGASDDGTMERVLLAIAEAIEERGRMDADVVASFDHRALAAVRAAHPHLAIAPDRMPERGQVMPEAVVAQAVAVSADILQIHHAELDDAVVAKCHAAGVAVWAWPVNDHGEILRAARLGVDGLMGDDVAALVEAMA
jgi:glycerophosphoryl diester phosphodiesterase